MASRSRSIDHAPDGTLEEIRRKDTQFRRMQESADYRHAQLVADAWCAAFVWTKRPGAPDALTTDTLRRLREDPRTFDAAQQSETERMADAYGFFHWHLAFPEVFVNSGFDCVIGNPPWENIRADPKEFFGPTMTLDRVNQETVDHAHSVDQSYSVCSHMERLWVEHCRLLAGQRHLIKTGGRFPLGAHGKCNTMPLFIELFVKLTARNAQAGIIVKSVIATDVEYQRIFRSLVISHRLSSFFDFVNEHGLFPDVHRQERFALITVSPPEKSPVGSYAFELQSLSDLHNPRRLLRLSADDLEAVSSGSCRVVTIADAAEFHLLIAISKSANAAFLSTESAIENHIMLDGGKVSQAPGYCTSESVTSTLTDGHRKAVGEDGEVVVPVYEGKLFGNVDHRLRTFTGVPSSARYGKTPSLPLVPDKQKRDPTYTIEPRHWISQDHVFEWLRKRGWRRQWIVLHSRKGNRENRRTFSVSVAPACASVDVAPIILPKEPHDLRAAVLAVAIGQTFVFDYLIRQRLVGFTIGKNLLREIPAFRWNTYLERCPWRVEETLCDWLKKRVLELAYTAWELQSFARDCGWYGPPFQWDEGRRKLISCEIDAAFFFLYLRSNEVGDWSPVVRCDSPGHDEKSERKSQISRYFATPRDGVAYIMDTFDKVGVTDESSYGEYRTKRIILELYDAMQAAVATGEPYRTLLDPAPADPSCCHPPLVAVVDLASVADGEWARPKGDQTGTETAVLAAVLKAIGRPASTRTVRLTALLAMEPRLLTPSLSVDDAGHWQRLVGPEATAHDSATGELDNYAWGAAVHQLRGTGCLIENLSDGTWAPGSGLEEIRTDGWPDGRVGVVVQTLRRRDPEEIVRTLPENVRDWIDVKAA